MTSLIALMQVHHVTLFQRATSSGLSLTAAFFLCRFLALYCFKCDWPNFLGAKLYSPNIITPKHVDKTKLTQNGWKKVFWRKS